MNNLTDLLKNITINKLGLEIGGASNSTGKLFMKMQI